MKDNVTYSVQQIFQPRSNKYLCWIGIKAKSTCITNTHLSLQFLAKKIVYCKILSSTWFWLLSGNVPDTWTMWVSYIICQRLNDSCYRYSLDNSLSESYKNTSISYLLFKLEVYYMEGLTFYALKLARFGTSKMNQNQGPILRAAFFIQLTQIEFHVNTIPQTFWCIVCISWSQLW